MYSFAKIIVIYMISFSNGYLSQSQFKYHNNPKSIVNNHSSLIPTDTYKRKNNPNEYGNLVAYASPIKRSRTPTMLIDEGLSPFRNAFDYVVWACVIISVFNPPPPPPPPPMTPLLVEENLGEKYPVFRVNDWVVLYPVCWCFTVFISTLGL